MSRRALIALGILIITAAVAAPIFAEEFQHAGTAGYASGLPAVELERVYTSYRFENVTQREAEALFSSAVAAIYWPDRREVQLLSADRLEAARTWLALKARQELAASTTGVQRTASSIDEKLGEQGSSRLSQFLGRTAEAAAASLAEAEVFLAKTPVVKERLSHGVGSLRTLPVKAQGTEYYIYQDFEGDVWALWAREDNNGGQYTWGIKSCDSYSGYYSADAPRGGSVGNSLSCSGSYPSNVEMYMYSQACMSAQPWWLGYLQFRFNASLDNSNPGDRFGTYVVGPDNQLYGYYFWGNWSYGWYDLVFNVRQWWALGDLALNYCNTLYLGFETDSQAAGSGVGARVDDLYVRYGDFVSSYECSVIADPWSGTAPLTVAFRPSTDMYSPTYYWSFGDGSTSEAQEPVHTYNAPGDYGVYMRLSSYGSYCIASKAIHVTQGTCSYQLGSTSSAFTYGGGSGTVPVTASASSCTWGATSNNSWITVTGGASNTGSGTVYYSVAQNSTTSARTGTLTIAGQTFTVTQSGMPTCTAPSFTAHPTSLTIASGGTATLNVSVTGSAPFSYQWYRGQNPDTSNPITGANSSSFTTPALTSTTSYWVRVTNACGSASSNTATITVTGGGGSYSYLIPAVAHALGANQTVWRTDMSLVNEGNLDGSVTLTYASVVTGLEVMATRTLLARNTLSWNDVLTTLFGMDPSAADKGVVKIVANRPLCIVSRTYNWTANGTFGQSYPALTIDDAITYGKTAVLPHLTNNAAFRTNVGFVNLGTARCAVTVRLYGPDGAQLGNAVPFEIDPGRYSQIDRVHQVAGAGTQDLSYAKVELETTGASVWVFAAVVDNVSGDPTTIEMIVP